LKTGRKNYFTLPALFRKEPVLGRLDSKKVQEIDRVRGQKHARNRLNQIITTTTLVRPHQNRPASAVLTPKELKMCDDSMVKLEKIPSGKGMLIDPLPGITEAAETRGKEGRASDRIGGVSTNKRERKS
jgi:hypothetical protein